jgi:hypothetical protein
MEDHKLVEPFCTEGGALNGFDRGLCFAMGVEWERFRQKLKTGEPFTDIVISDNAERLSAMAERQRRFVEHHPVSLGWAEIIVGDYVV